MRVTRTRLRSWARWTGKATGLLLIAALFACYLGRHVDPADQPVLGLFLLSFPIVLLLNALGLLIGLLRKSRWAIAYFLALLICWPMVRDWVQLRPAAESSPQAIRVLSYNTELLGFYQFDRNESLRARNLQMLDSVRADIFCFQEFYKSGAPNGFKTLSLIQERMGPYETHEKYTHEFVHDQHFGVVTLSRFPIVHRGYVPFEGEINNFCIFTDIVLPGQDTLRVYNAHLASLHFRAEDYRLLRGEFSSWVRLQTQWKSVMDKTRSADLRRSEQVSAILSEIETSPYPVLLAGDLNTPPFSHAYLRLSSVLQDAFTEQGSGIAASFKTRLPYLRIDHVLASEEIDILRHTTVQGGASDHRPVLVEFEIRK